MQNSNSSNATLLSEVWSANNAPTIRELEAQNNYEPPADFWVQAAQKTAQKKPEPPQPRLN